MGRDKGLRDLNLHSDSVHGLFGAELSHLARRILITSRLWKFEIRLVHYLRQSSVCTRLFLELMREKRRTPGLGIELFESPFQK